MKNSVNVSIEVSMKIPRLLNTTVKIWQDDNQKVDTSMSKISIFPRAIRYDISISNRYFRYIEASLVIATSN